MKKLLIPIIIITISACGHSKKENLQLTEKQQIFSTQPSNEQKIDLNNSYLKLKNLYESNENLFILAKKDAKKELKKSLIKLNKNIKEYIDTSNLGIKYIEDPANELNFIINETDYKDNPELKLIFEEIITKHYENEQAKIQILADKYNKLPKKILNKLDKSKPLSDEELKMLMIHEKNHRISYDIKHYTNVNKDDEVLLSLQRTSHEIDELLSNDNNLVNKLLSEPKYIKAIANINELSDEEAIEKFKCLKKHGLDFGQTIFTGATARNAIIFIISNSKINNSMKVRNFLSSNEI